MSCTFTTDDCRKALTSSVAGAPPSPLLTAMGRRLPPLANITPKKDVKSRGMITVNNSARRSRRVSTRSLTTSVQTRFTATSRVPSAKAQDRAGEEDEREAQRHEQVQRDVGDSATAHHRVPAVQ